MSWAARKQERQGHRGNLGRYSKVPAKRVKKSRKPNIVITCITCGIKRNMPKPRSISFKIA